MQISYPVSTSGLATNADMQTVLGRLTAVRAGNLDNIDELVSLAEQRKLVAGGPGTIVIPDGAINVCIDGGVAAYGAWTQLIAATGSALLAISAHVELDSAATTINWGEFQIGVGAAGSEVVQATYPLPTRSSADNVGQAAPRDLFLALPIANGVRVAARTRTAPGALHWGIWLTAVNPANVQKWSA